MPLEFSTQQEFHAELERLQALFDTMQPELELTVHDTEMGVEGFVVVWNTDICLGGPLDNDGKGCGKGGTRIKKELVLHDVRRLARAMAEKNSAAGLPLGGAKSGLNTDPNAPDYEKKWKRFVQLVKDEGVLLEDGGIFGGFGYDIGGKPPLNALWTMEQLGSGRSFTGKPLEHGGTDYDKIGIAGLGVAVAGRTLLDLKTDIDTPSFAVQGVGAMGSAVIKYFSDLGGVLKTVSDIRYGGTWEFETAASNNFINSPSLENLEKEAKKISDSSLEALYADVDIIFPCALEDTFTHENATKVKAKFIAEGANNPTTAEAHEIFFDNGVIVAPDILSNAGGIIAAFVEMTSDSSNKADEAIALTKERVTANIRDLISYVDGLGLRPDLVADYMTYRNIFKGV